MAVTQNSAVREVLSQIVRDPRYEDATRVSLLAPQQAVLVFGSIGLFVLSCWAYMAGYAPIWLAIPANIVAVYLAFSPVHDASHRAVSSNGFLNDALGVLAGQLLLPGVNMTAFRTIHMDHHRFTGEEGRDPDTALVDPPKWAGLAYLMFADLNWVYWYYKHGRKVWSRKVSIAIHVTLAVVIVSHLAFLLSPWWKEFLLLYVVPQRVGLGIAAYNFAHIQHPSGLTWKDEPFRATVFIAGQSALRRLMFGQEDHVIHHLVPHVPWFKYSRIWELANGALREQGIPERQWTHWGTTIEPLDEDADAPVPMQIAAMVEEAGQVRSFTLAPVGGQKLPAAHAGAHIEVTLPNGLVRQYSVVEHDRMTNTYRIAVKREEQGRGGSLAMHALATGDTILVSPPRNHFVLYEDAPAFRLVSGGIGITPLFAMARRLVRLGKPFAFHVCARTEAELPFRNDLLNGPLARATQVHFDTGDGRSSFDPAAALANPAMGELLYLCGPRGFMDWIRDAALGLGWDARQILDEKFGGDMVIADNHAFEVKLAKSKISVEVGKDQSIIDALALAGFDAPFACMQGTCGRCAAPVLEGEADHRDAYFTEQEHAHDNRLCLCVSRAKGESLTLVL